MDTQAQPERPRNNYLAKSGAVDPFIVAEWPINRHDTVRLSIEQFKGVWLVNLRKWFEAEDSELRPGKGIALSVRHLPQLAEAVAKALSIARERGLMAVDGEAGK